MSFILDALRKSETARRRSEAPDLFTTMPNAVEPTTARTQWPMLAIGAIGVLSLIIALWLFSQRDDQPAPSPTTADATADPQASTGTPAFETSETALPSAQAVPEPASKAAPAPPIAPRVSPPLPVQTTPPPASVTVDPPDLPAPPQTSTAPPPRPAPPPTSAPTGIAGDQIVALADLDPGIRNQLPPLKLSMHLWNETPSQRFIILDGQRLKEGDVLGEIVIERITRDGAMLAWRGGRLKIELR
jgi:general secretion pathway protein B